MDAPPSGAVMLVRFIAVVLIGIGVIELSLSWLQSSANHTRMGPFDFVLPAILSLAGIIVLIKTRSIAAWISDKLDG
jgi:hypothetical protein